MHKSTFEGQRVYAARYYQAHKEYFRAAKRRERFERRLLIDDLKNAPCLDCRRRYPPWVMQFDHRDPSVKLFNIGRMTNKPKRAIYDEAAKCDVVCANCHAERTHRGRA